MRKLPFYSILFILFSPVASQQVSKQDYSRAVSFLWSNLNNKKVFNTNMQPAWFADSSGFSFITQSPEGKSFNKVDLKKMEVEKLFDHEKLAKLLSDTLKTTVKPTDLPVNSFRYIDPSHLEFNLRGIDYYFDLSNYSITKKTAEAHNEMEEKSPDGKWIAYSEGNNLFIRSTESGQKKQLSYAGKKNYEYASYYNWGEIIEGEGGERPPHLGVYWSPDSKWIQTYICDLTRGQKMYLLDWSVDTLYKAKLLSYYRGSPGDTDMVYMIPVYFNIETGEEIRRDALRNVNAASFEWAKEPGIIFEENHVRGYQHIDLYRQDLNKKAQETIYAET
ncbi:MAG TPA: DPP IV N-terminal domain-containing protein, partial [Chitinophagaceae bacterium]|nr:DPP IV N-terminal domain-containing protein [Chitinophagaceae bacterium]